MAYVVNDRIEVSIFINDIDYPLGLGQNTLNFLHMGASVRQFLPTCHISVIDTQHTLDALNLQDGVTIRVAIKAKNAPTESYQFRKFNHKRMFQGDSYRYDFDGYLDFPKFWAGTGKNNVNGTSWEALKFICDECGMQFRRSPANDNQIWIQRNRTFAAWARAIESCAYSSDASYMKWAVQFSGVMNYVNINGLPDPKVKVVAYQDVDGAFKCIDYGAVTKSGVTNAVNGYSAVRQEQSATGESRANDQVTFKADTRSPMINTAVKEKQGRGAQTYGPIDFGNTHENYERAYYQNQRYASLYSVDVNFLFQELTNLSLFTPFTFAVENEKVKQDVAYAGNYVLSGRAIYIRDANYYELIQGTRSGTNLNYSAK